MTATKKLRALFGRLATATSVPFLVGCAPFFALLFGGLTGATSVWLDKSGDCSDPFVLGEEDVGLVVLPYAIVENVGEEELTTAATQLAPIIQSEILLNSQTDEDFEVIRYRGEDCDPAVVEAKLLDRIPRETQQIRVSDGKAVVILSGRIFQQDNAVFVQSEIRFRRRDKPEQARVSFGQTGEIVISSTLERQSILFPPRVIATDVLSGFKSNFVEVSKLISEAEFEPTGVTFNFERNASYAAVVRPSERASRNLDAAEYQWVQITNADKTKRTGLIRKPDGQLREAMPEIAFLDVLISYLSKGTPRRNQSAAIPAVTGEDRESNIGSGPKTSTDGLSSSRLKQLIQLYDRLESDLASSAANASFPRTTAWVLYGYLAYDQVQSSSNFTVQRNAIAETKYAIAQANSVQRFNPTVHSFRTVSAMADCCKYHLTDDLDPREDVLEPMLADFFLFPTDEEVTRNLLSLYSYLLVSKREDFGLTRNEVENSRDAFKILLDE